MIAGDRDSARDVPELVDVSDGLLRAVVDAVPAIRDDDPARTGDGSFDWEWKTGSAVTPDAMRAKGSPAQ